MAAPCARGSMKQGILLAGAGSGHQGAASSLDHITRRVRERWPGLPCVAARTSGGHAGRGAAALALPTAEAGLDQLKSLGVEHAVIQSLHIIPGREFHRLLCLAQEHRRTGTFARLDVGVPLLGSEADIEAVARAVLRVAPERAGDGQAVLLMGHGTEHPGHDFYPALAARLAQLDPGVFMGTMDAAPGLADILARLEDFGARKVFLLPFLFGAGAHANRDMAGESGAASSWRERLLARGLDCEPVLKGAGEYDAFADIWLDHLAEALGGPGAQFDANSGA